MSVVDDAEAAHAAWKETAQGSYLERVIADSIVPALIHAARRKPVPLGFGGDVELASDTEIAAGPDHENEN